jgi:hypothetical protein
MTPAMASRYLCGSLLWRRMVSKMKDASRRLNRLRRKVYRETLITNGSRAKSTALALWRAFTKKSFRAWCYEFGFSGSLTHTVTIVEADGLLRIHDAFFNLTFPPGLYEVLDALRGGNSVAPKTEIRDRKIYVMNPAFEPETTLRWLEANADRELAPIDGLRRFEVLWNLEAFTAIAPASRWPTATSRSRAIRATCGT